MPKNTYMVPITRKTETVYEVEASNGREAVFLLSAQLANGEAKVVAERQVSQIVGEAKTPVPDPSEAQEPSAPPAKT